VDGLVVKHLIQIGLAWLIILFAWSLFSWLVGASWVGPGIIALLFPVVLIIVMVPFLLTWIADRLRL
jgi:hypothetical protein